MTLIMCHVGLNRYMTQTGIIVMSSLVGDGIAAIMGIEYGRHVYRAPLSGIGPGRKSIEGSIGCAFGTAGGMLLFSYVTGIEISRMGGEVESTNYHRTMMPMAIVYGIISAVVEATALRNYDNLILAFAMEMSVKRYNAGR